MEVVAATPNGGGVPPFHDHDVREWSRIDSITGALERARLETDHWSANTINSSHKYGKVVDSRARTDADGALQQQARRQLEVFQSQIPGGHLQVIKTHTVSSSRWTNKTSPTIGDGAGFGSKDFENLQLPLNPLDLSSQKSKATVGRSASRRPPTRQRPREASSTPADFHNPLRNAHITAATNLHRVSRLCHQIHETAVRQAFGKRSPRPSIRERQSGDGSVEIYEVESVSSRETNASNGHTNLSRTKSTSSDDIHIIPEKDSSTKSIEDLEDLEQLQNWRRTSKIRRSLQFPKQNKATSSKPLDLPENSVSVRKIREDLEKGRRLNTALRNNSVDFEALDQILQSISSSSSILSDKASDNLDDIENEQSPNRKQKRNSFVTVESIKEVKGRLRRTSSPTNDIYKVNGKEDDPDDGIVTEEINNKEMPVIEKSVGQSRVRSYVYGMEALLNKKPGLGTGSLESRVKLVNGNANSRNEDWYNRRKSYGFEQMHNQEEPSNSMSFKSKNLVESSTDSGICRSSEIVVVPTATKTGAGYNEEDNAKCSSDNNSDLEQKYNGIEDQNGAGLSFGKVKQMANTFNQDETSPLYNKAPQEKPWEKFSSYKPSDWSNSDTELKSTTIKIPIMKNNNIVDLSWNDEPEKDIKRHSIAVDESKYVTRNTNENKFRRTSLALNDQFVKDEDDINPNRKPKKVEFCKTEVHFAAESGKVNIVATDEKPPPTQNFRRRRRISPLMTEDFNKNGLPVLHFGDSSYEKTMFGIVDDLTDTKTDNLTSIYENVQSSTPPTFGVVTVNTNNNTNNEYVEEDKKDLVENENIKGILKNKPIKPKPYHLGETVPFSETNSDEESKNWGVRLRHVEKEETPIWKSTVTVHNYYDKPKSEDPEQPEFQKLLKNLRPTRKSDYMSDNENRYSDNFSSIRVVPSVKDNRRSSWSVADKIKTVEESQSVESRGYSTKVNFGEGEATVVENDGFYDKDRHPTWPRMENSSKDNTERLNEPPQNTDSNRNNSPRYTNSKRSNLSPVVLRKAIPVINRPDLKSAVTTEKLSSPSLVGRNCNSYDYTEKTEPPQQVSNGRQSPIKDFKNSLDKKLQAKHINDSIVLRQPKKSEMTYFGVNLSPKPVKKISQAVIRKENKLSDKPDLLQHYKKSPSPTRKIKATNKAKPRHKSPETIKESTGPIYENLKDHKGRYTREFDSSILDELTKAADQILQAVNGYTDEDTHNRFSSDDEDTRKKNKRNEQLETISETKSWKQQTAQAAKTKPPHTKTKLKHTSSTSSVESVSHRRVTPTSTERKPTPMKSTTERQKKKTEKSDSSTAKANTKARRLQRASSREALLQSHGSSSEDLAANVEMPVRKPRLIKKTKAMQLTVSNGLDIKKLPSSVACKREKEASIRSEERILGSLPEIRHKTAVSTIRSTADKATRERTRHRGEELKKKAPQKREGTRGTNPSSRTEKEKIKTATLNKETVTHRISTANIKKCHRSEGGPRH